jgi:hypothetical protein
MLRTTLEERVSTMRTGFADLSREGKLAKIDQHLGVGHPVPSDWVQ